MGYALDSYSDSYSPPPFFPYPYESGGDEASTSSSNSSRSIGIGIGAGVAVLVVSAGISTYRCIYLKRRRAERLASGSDAARTQSPPTISNDDELAAGAGTASAEALISPSGFRGSSQLGHRCFTYEQLSLATKHFSKTQLLGQGGSGSVYRGKLPEDGALVAVKCIPENSNQGLKEFTAEVSIISELRHRNLVKLKGWCHDQGNFFVVYDLMSNGSLDHLLYDDALCFKLKWERRYWIAIGLGSALLYLHEECDKVIIHRDVKSSNVLLDEGFTAKLGDFGLSRQVDLGVTSHMTTVVTGTRGYMAPECFVGSGKATKETDIYAFGAVLLEIVTGRRPLMDGSLQEYDGVLLDWVWDLFGQEKVLTTVDKRLGGEWNIEEAYRMLVVGLACLHPHAQSRPRMWNVLHALNGRVALPYVPLSKPVLRFDPSPPTSTGKIMLQTGSTANTSSSGTSSISSLGTQPISRPPSHLITR